jgi:hypothetical protein
MIHITVLLNTNKSYIIARKNIYPLLNGGYNPLNSNQHLFWCLVELGGSRI